MEPKKPVQGELQSKTVILSDEKHPDDLMSALDKQKGARAPATRRLDWITIAIVLLVLLVALELLWILLH